MGKASYNGTSDPESFDQRISQLEKRLSDLENRLSGAGAQGRFSGKDDEFEIDLRIFRSPRRDDGHLESRVGKYGMAWLGNIVLLAGILFLTQLLYNNDRILLSHALGFVSVAAIYLAARITGNSLPYLSGLFTYNGHILLFISAMGLHVFEKGRVIEGAIPGYGIVVAVLLALLYLGFRQGSQLLLVIVQFMAVVLAVAGNSTHLTLPVLTGMALTSIYGAVWKHWGTGLILSVVLVYLTFMLWILGNPLANRTIGFIPRHQYGHIYLFVIALAYSGLALLPTSDRSRDAWLKASIVLNGIGFSFLIALASLAFFTHNYFLYFGLIAAFCLGYAVYLKARNQRPDVASMYAIYCFVALSITIAGLAGFPFAFFLLSLESLLVVSIALWFRSKFIVRMNTLLFVGILITYLATSEPFPTAHFAFALVALLTARILNWKKERLEIRTEHIRNLYLLTGTAVLLHALHLTVPDPLVTLSWAMTAVLFFILSILIRNIKYRWLAIGTMILAVGYLFIIDLSSISLGYRIVALLFIAMVSLGISIFYARKFKARDEEQH